MTSILTSVKKLLGIDELDTSYDVDIIIDINSVFSILNQMGIGPTTPFSIVDKNDDWDDFIADFSGKEFIKTYLYMKVRMMFDPPQSSQTANAITETIKELEYRMYTQANYPLTGGNS